MSSASEHVRNEHKSNIYFKSQGEWKVFAGATLVVGTLAALGGALLLAKAPFLRSVHHLRLKVGIPAVTVGGVLDLAVVAALIKFSQSRLSGHKNECNNSTTAHDEQNRAYMINIPSLYGSDTFFHTSGACRLKSIGTKQMIMLEGGKKVRKNEKAMYGTFLYNGCDRSDNNHFDKRMILPVGRLSAVPYYEQTPLPYLITDINGSYTLMFNGKTIEFEDRLSENQFDEVYNVLSKIDTGGRFWSQEEATEYLLLKKSNIKNVHVSDTSLELSSPLRGWTCIWRDEDEARSKKWASVTLPLSNKPVKLDGQLIPYLSQSTKKLHIPDQSSEDVSKNMFSEEQFERVMHSLQRIKMDELYSIV